MFALVIFIGIIGNLIFLAGIMHLLSSVPLLFLTLFSLIILFILAKSATKPFLSEIKSWGKTEYLLVSFLAIASLVNLVGALGPELAFDALWYHLTLPKLYLQQHAIYFLPGNLLYYSAMPQLGEMYYIIGIFLHGAVLAKVLHFVFGIFALSITYLLAKKFVDKRLSLVASLIFASNLVFAWESTTAYIDLTRTFFECAALLSWITWIQRKEKPYLFFTGIFVGFALETKLLSIGSLAIFAILTLSYDLVNKRSYKKIVKHLFALCIPPLLIMLPWFLFSLSHTGSPFYPFFPKTYSVEAGSQMTISSFLGDTWTLLTHADDPLSPVYIIIFPLLILSAKKLSTEAKWLLGYCGGSLLFWYLAPHIGQARYILPYLPAWSVLTVIIISLLTDILLQKAAIGAPLFFLLITILYRGIANARYVPVIIGRETTSQFLTTHLNFSYGDFYDTDGYFARQIKPNDKVLLINFHNLYYVDFPFVHQSWLTSTDHYDYIATQAVSLPTRYSNWIPIYTNPLTHVTVYIQKVIIRTK